MRRMAIAPNLESVCKYTWPVHEVWNIPFNFSLHTCIVYIVFALLSFPDLHSG